MADKTTELREQLRFEVKRMVLSSHDKDDGCVDEWTDKLVHLFTSRIHQAIGDMEGLIKQHPKHCQSEQTGDDICTCGMVDVNLAVGRCTAILRKLITEYEK